MKVIPVIHFENDAQALANAELARDAGCHGVFLISMEGEDDRLAAAGALIRSRCPGLFVGVNFLTMRSPDALRASLAAGFDATWCDSVGIANGVASEQAKECAGLLSGKAHQLFASVAFKYQPVDPDAPASAAAAASLGFVPTTSGVKTGAPPTAGKLRDMRAQAKNAGLAVASGLSPENLSELGPYITHALVSTGVSMDWHNFDRDRLEAFATAAAAF